MLSFLKKKNKEEAPQAPAWHPNFRNYERLPDTKVVRTAFFVNGATALVAIALAVFLGMREYELANLKGELAAAEQQIEADKGESAQAVALFQKFKEEENRIKEVDTFLKAKTPPSDVLQRLAETRPDNIAFETLNLTEAGIYIRGTVRGTVTEALSEASAYVEQLRGDTVLNSRFESVEPGESSPNPTTGRLAFEVKIKYKAVPAAK